MLAHSSFVDEMSYGTLARYQILVDKDQCNDLSSVWNLSVDLMCCSCCMCDP